MTSVGGSFDRAWWDTSVTPPKLRSGDPPQTSSKLTDVNSAGIADGQILVWNAATGKFIPGSQLARQKLAYAENGSNVQQAIAGTSTANGVAVDLTNLSISVPATPGLDVWLEARFYAGQSVVGQGSAQLLIVETTSGATVVEQFTYILPNTIALRSVNFSILARVNLGATVITRTFKVQARCDSTGATVPSFNVLHLSAAKSFLHAWAE